LKEDSQIVIGVKFSFFHRRFILKEFLKENPTENSTTTSFSFSKRIFVLKFFFQVYQQNKNTQL